jgi:hypothetical protein
MKKFWVTLAIAVTASAIVLSLLAPVNHSISQRSGNHLTLVADGDPMPPYPPPPPPPGNSSSVVLVADGDPMPPYPPPPPPPSGSSSVIATSWQNA